VNFCRLGVLSAIQPTAISTIREVHSIVIWKFSINVINTIVNPMLGTYKKDKSKIAISTSYATQRKRDKVAYNIICSSSETKFYS